jgi:hypothetical protein
VIWAILMSAFSLTFRGTKYPILPAHLSVFFAHHRTLSSSQEYEVTSPVDADVFRAFIDSLQNQRPIQLTRANVTGIASLAAEFCLGQLATDCAAFLGDSLPPHPPTYDPTNLRAIHGRIAAHDRRLESLARQTAMMAAALDSLQTGFRTELPLIRDSLRDLTTDVNNLKSSPHTSQSLNGPIALSTSISPQSLNPSLSLSKSSNPSSDTISPKPLSELEVPWKDTEIGNGIIACLVGKNSWGWLSTARLHDDGIVKLTSRSYSGSHHPKNVVVFTDDLYFESESNPGQWICWDFIKMRVKVAHYNIKAAWLKSWVVESSEDGETWIEIDRHTDNANLAARSWVPGWGPPWKIASFTVANPVRGRFVRLMQLAANHRGNDVLAIQAVEFFGTLFM